MYLSLSTAYSSIFGAYFLMNLSAANLAVIDLLQHKSTSDWVQGIWDGVTLSNVADTERTVVAICKGFTIPQYVANTAQKFFKRTVDENKNGARLSSEDIYRSDFSRPPQLSDWFIRRPHGSPHTLRVRFCILNV